MLTAPGKHQRLTRGRRPASQRSLFCEAFGRECGAGEECADCCDTRPEDQALPEILAVGMKDSPDPISLLTHASGDLNAMGSQEVLPLEVVLDSDAVDHVADSMEAPGYKVDPSATSAAKFAAANGESIPNQGETILNLTTTEGHPIKSKFQVCQVSRPLWSVSKICDAGCSVTFDDKGATVTHTASGKNLCSFERKRGLYTTSLPLNRPGKRLPPSSSFSRQDGK